MAIEAYATSPETSLAAVALAFAAVYDVETRMHPQREGSDLHRINTTPPGSRIAIDASTHHLLSLARRLHELTGGAFDPCLPSKPGRLGDVGLSPGVPGSAAAAPPWARCRAPVALDFGGIAKGYAIDCAIETLIAAGCSAGLVNAGGDVRLFGARRESVLLRCDAGYRPLTLANTALAVSDVDATRPPPGHRGYYLRGGATVVMRRRYAAVLAPTAVAADALTKCLLLCPQPLASRALREFGGRSVAATALPATSPPGSR